MILGCHTWQTLGSFPVPTEESVSGKVTITCRIEEDILEASSLPHGDIVGIDLEPDAAIRRVSSHTHDHIDMATQGKNVTVLLVGMIG